MENKEPSMQERFEETFKDCGGEYSSNIDAPRKMLKSFIQSEIDRAVAKREEEIVEMIERWVIKNHMHHEFADEHVPKGFYGCSEKDYPYVNSLELINLITKQ